MTPRYVPPIVLVAALLVFAVSAQNPGVHTVTMLIQGYATNTNAPAHGKLRNCIRNMFSFAQTRESAGNKICERLPTFIECVDNRNDPDESIVVLEDLLTVVCAMGLTGTQISNFFTASRTCFTGQLDALSACYSTGKAAPPPVAQSEQCIDLDALRRCVAAELAHCEEPMVAAVMDRLFALELRKKRPACVHRKRSATQLAVSTTLMVTGLAMVLMVGHFCVAIRIRTPH